MATILPKTKHTRQAAHDKAAASSSVGPQSQSATITSAVAAEPDLPPLKAASRLFPNPPAWKRAILRVKIKEQLEEGRVKKWKWHKGAVHAKNLEPDDEELKAVCERYGYRFGSEEQEKDAPSRLFTMMLADACLPIPRYPLSGVVSPSLLATTGIVPFTIFSTGPDIIQHYYDCIVSAQKEVLCLTNYWQLGKNVDRIADALRELNTRQQKRKEGDAPINGHADGKSPKVKVAVEDQIVVKMMWDRGPQTLADLFRVRKPVPPSMWKSNGLPTEKDVPYLNIEILNYHRPLMGTFHAKLLLVDRRVALINSNNIQDRPNLEACTRLEGDIVNSVYDHALISWGNRLNPSLPCLSSPAPKIPSAAAFSGGEDSTLPHLTAQKLREIARSVREKLKTDDEAAEDDWMTKPSRKMSFAEVVDGVMRRDGPSSPILSPSTPKMKPSSGATSMPSSPSGGNIDRDQAARNAGAEWARKVLGERFHNQLASFGSPQSTATQTAQHGTSTDVHQQLNTPNRRHFADVVYALMEKEGIKPGLWAEGALDTFGLGPSSSRNVLDDARRSRNAAKNAMQKGISVPQAVEEEATKDDELVAAEIAKDEEAVAPNSVKGDEAVAAEHVKEDEATAARGDHDIFAKMKSSSTAGDDNPHTKADAVQDETLPASQAPNAEVPTLDLEPTSKSVRAEKGIDAHVSTSQSSPSTSTGNLDTLKHSQASAQGTTTTAGEDEDGEDGEDGENTPGARAYQRRRRTVSTRSRASASERLAAITKSLDFANLSQVRGEITAQQLAAMTDRAWEQGDEFTKGAIEILDFNPYIFHLPHQPVPMALVNRRPHGTPGHSDIRNAQDAAWLAGFRYAKKHIFLQSPTLNATPIKHAVLHAVRRHVRVELWLGLGFNDKSESMPFQGGTNENVVTRLYRQLRREGKGDEQYLDVYWYTGKDMTRPLNAVRKQRNCHVKYVSFDGQVAIIGSGNQDTQSWFHSQEINVMVDSKQIVGEWDRGLRRNQSTQLYGKVGKDGIWRGREGKEVVDKGADK